MTWVEAEAALRAHIEAGWAVGAYAATLPLLWENENDAAVGDRFVYVSIEGVFAEKTLYGSTGKRSSVEGGVVFFHAFVPTGRGKSEALGAVIAMTQILELQTVSGISLEGGEPPSASMSRSHADRSIPLVQPGGNYFRCSGSVPFIVIGTR